MKDKTIYYTVYKITNLITKEYYFGKHKQKGKLQDSYFCSGVKATRSLNLWGKNNFKREILYFYKTESEANKKEKELVEKCINKDLLCLNIMVGGKGGWDHVHTKEIYSKRIEKFGNLMGQCHTPEVRSKIEKTCIEKYGSICGHLHTPEVKELIKNKYGSLTSMLHTKEAQEKSKKTRLKKYGNLMGSCHTKEVKDKMVEKYGSIMGQCFTKEAISSRRETFIKKYGKPNGNANSDEAIRKGRETKYKKHVKKDPSFKDLVLLKKGEDVIWEGEKYYLLVYLYGFESAIKLKNTLVNKLDKNKTWKKGSKWNGYTISSKKLQY